MNCPYHNIEIYRDIEIRTMFMNLSLIYSYIIKYEYYITFPYIMH